MAKSNLAYLQELLADNEEANEWLEGLTSEYQEKIDDLKSEVSELESQVNSNEERIIELEDLVEGDGGEMEELDFGLDKIEYRTSGNLKVNQFMEDLAERVKCPTFNWQA